MQWKVWWLRRKMDEAKEQNDRDTWYRLLKQYLDAYNKLYNK